MTTASAGGARSVSAASVTHLFQNDISFARRPDLLFGMSAAAIVWLGWRYRDSEWLHADSGVGYALGIVAVGCVLGLLIYPLRKRLRWMPVGSVRIWFRIHMTLGVLAPIAALYHCGFQVGSMNSRIALFSMLLVAGSGLVGRYLYRKVNRSLSGQRTDLHRLRKEMRDEQLAGSNLFSFLHVIKNRTAVLDQSILDGTQTSILASVVGLNRASYRMAREKASLMFFAEQHLRRGARHSSLLQKHQFRFLSALDDYLERHMARLQELAKLQAYERLFALWHVAHLPFFFLLLVSVTVHVFAVHLY